MLPGMMPLYLLAFCRVVIGLVFVVSSISKARNLAQFRQTISAFHLLPERFSGVTALLFIGGEFAVSFLMFIGGPLLLPGFSLAISLLLLFSLALGSVVARKIPTSCSCFGASTKPVSPFDVGRNVGFLLCALGGCFVLIWTQNSQVTLSLPEWLLTGLSAGVFVIIWLQLGEVLQLLRQS
jgi:hypothetical protein